MVISVSKGRCGQDLANADCRVGELISLAPRGETWTRARTHTVRDLDLPLHDGHLFDSHKALEVASSQSRIILRDDGASIRTTLPSNTLRKGKDGS